MVADGDSTVTYGESISSVPEKFIRSEKDVSEDVVLSALSEDLPIIDLSLLSSGDLEELRKLDKACKDWGFFQVINHGIEEVVLQSMKDASAEFFNLPLQEKIKYPMDIPALQGYGLPNAVGEEQTHDWVDSLNFRLHPVRLRKLELWPTKPSEFKEVVETYSAEIRRVGEELIGSLSVIMKMDKDNLIGLHKEVSQLMRVNYYPICSNPERVLGLGPHSDPVTITILVQEDGVVGLQIRHGHGHGHGHAWVPIKPIPNSLVVNLGDLVEIWSNGKYKSIEHRAVASKTKRRMSFATFFSPSRDVEVEPLEQMLDIQQPNRVYKKIKFEDYLANSQKKKHDGKSRIETVKIRI